jgi:hypothetical protein
LRQPLDLARETFQALVDGGEIVAEAIFVVPV